MLWALFLLIVDPTSAIVVRACAEDESPAPVPHGEEKPGEAADAGPVAPTITVTGTAQFEDGTPVPRAIIEAQDEFGGVARLDVREGRLSGLLFVEGAHRVGAMKIGSADIFPEEPIVLSLLGGYGNAVVLRQPKDVRVRFVDGDGRAIKGVRSHFDDPSRPTRTFDPGRSVIPPQWVMASDALATDPMGAVVVPAVYDVRRIWATAPGHAWTAVAVLNNRNGRSMEICLPPGGSIIFNVPLGAASEGRSLIDSFGGELVAYDLPTAGRIVRFDGLVVGRHSLTLRYRTLGSGQERSASLAVEVRRGDSRVLYFGD
jgi:hypothetical protein